MPVPGYRKPGYHKLFELLNDAVIVTDAHRRILYINPSAQALLQCTNDDVRGQPLTALGMSGARADGRDTVPGARAMPDRVYRSDGLAIDVELSLIELPFGPESDTGIVAVHVRPRTDAGAEYVASFPSVVTRVAARLSSTLDIKAIGEILMEALTDLGAISAELWLPSPNADQHHLCASRGPSAAALFGPHADAGLDVYLHELGKCAHGSRPVILDATGDFRFLRDWMPPHAAAAVVIPFLMADNKPAFCVVYVREPPAPRTVDAFVALVALAGARIGESRLLAELHAANRARDEAHALLDSLFSNAPLGLAFLDNSLRCIRINDTLSGFDPVSAQAHAGMSGSGVGGALGPHTEALRRQVLESNIPLTNIELTNKPSTSHSSGAHSSGASGDRRHWLVNYYPIRSRDGGSLGIGAVVVETTERKRMERLLRERSFLEAVLQNLKDGVVACDADENLIIVNQTIQDFHAPQAVQPIPPERWAKYYDLFMPDGVTRMAKEQIPLFRALAGEALRDVEMVIAPVSGRRRVVMCNGQAIYNEHGRKLGAVVTMHDITGYKRTKARLTRQAQHDPLTGLTNRRAFMQRLRHALRRAEPRPSSVALLFLDLDNFKAINDNHGHETGDGALSAIAGRLLGSVRAGDTVARLGGDEFVVLCENPTEKTEAISLSKRIETAVAAPLALEPPGIEVMTSISIGIAFARGGETAEQLLREADKAMYRAKQHGRARSSIE